MAAVSITSKCPAYVADLHAQAILITHGLDPLDESIQYGTTQISCEE
jgi:hypothetical protein